MKPRLLLAFVAGLWFAPIVAAAPVPADNKNNSGPVLAAQTKSIDQLLDVVKATAKKFFPEPMYKELEKNALAKLNQGVLKGIDTQKPLGLYATLGEGIAQGNLANTSVVALVPVTNEMDFVDLLGRLELKVEKKGETYTIPIPNAPVSATVRFMKGYAYISVSTDVLDPKSLLQPQDVISDKEKAGIVLRVRVDRVPNDLKQLFLGGVAQGLDAAKNGGAPPAEKEFVELFGQTFLRWLRTGLEDSKEMIVRVDLDPNSGAFVVEKTVEAKNGTAFAKSIADLKATKNDFAGIVGSDSVGHVLLQTPLFVESLQEMLGKLVGIVETVALQDLEKDAPVEARDAIKELFAAIARTVKSGNADLAASLRGPGKDGLYTAVGAFSLKGANDLEKSIKAVLKVAPKEVGEIFKVDSFKVDGINVHEILVGDKLPPKAQKIFGKSPVYIALAPNATFITFGAQGKELMKEVLAAKLGPKPAPLIQAEINGKRLVTLLKNAWGPAGDDGPPKELIDALAQLDRASVLKVNLEGGDRLVVRLELGLLPLLGTVSRSNTIKVEPAPLPIKQKPK